MHPIINLSLADDDIFFDRTVSQLLLNIEITHSVREACNRVGLSYSSAWNRIRVLEDHLGCQIVNRSQGGAIGSGRSDLTVKGRLLLSLYDSFFDKLSEDMERRFHDTFYDVIANDIISPD